MLSYKNGGTEEQHFELVRQTQRKSSPWQTEGLSISPISIRCRLRLNVAMTSSGRVKTLSRCSMRKCRSVEGVGSAPCSTRWPTSFVARQKMICGKELSTMFLLERCTRRSLLQMLRHWSRHKYVTQIRRRKVFSMGLERKNSIYLFIVFHVSIWGAWSFVWGG